MEKKTREEIALMSNEELEGMVMNLQDEVHNANAALSVAREMKDLFYDKAKMMEMRMEVMMKLLKSWGMK
jgi:hypothetical protein